MSLPLLIKSSVSVAVFQPRFYKSVKCGVNFSILMVSFTSLGLNSCNPDRFVAISIKMAHCKWLSFLDLRPHSTISNNVEGVIDITFDFCKARECTEFAVEVDLVLLVDEAANRWNPLFV